jgi:hypothetical protein
MTVERQKFWRAPSGRIHSLKHCSGNGQPQNSKRVSLTEAEYDASVTCKCARWSVRRQQP